LLSSASSPWASGLFVGGRHRFVAEADAAALEGIADWEFTLFNHLVADILVIAVDGAQVTIEALTVAEA
jgi:hypothetical protein